MFARILFYINLAFAGFCMVTVIVSLVQRDTQLLKEASGGAAIWSFFVWFQWSEVKRQKAKLVASVNDGVASKKPNNSVQETPAKAAGPDL